ncbi:hypothetical protein KTF36_17535 [Burkholderia gladioli]|uniref:hypothetical protein n=1 Tax=Burkholderia gladioli TaxID=28095 RepID=UPI001C227869|nr:hypothetical protein [Burkholderia gladioli]MBU9643655.1 hypothetical protein [Burkholderia gladioli]
MRIHAATPHSERPENTADNVYQLTPHSQLIRHRAIREHLQQQISRHAEESIVAIASVTMQADGTVSISAKGIETDLADEMLDGLNLLSARIRHHTRVRTPSNRQRGSIALSVVTTVALTACAYVNAIPWIDSTLVLAAHFLANLTAGKRQINP